MDKHAWNIYFDDALRAADLSPALYHEIAMHVTRREQCYKDELFPEEAIAHLIDHCSVDISNRKKNMNNKRKIT